MRKTRLEIQNGKSRLLLLPAILSAGLLAGCNTAKQLDAMAGLEQPNVEKSQVIVKNSYALNQDKLNPQDDGAIKSIAAAKQKLPSGEIVTRNYGLSSITGETETYKRSLEEIQNTVSPYCRKILAEAGIEASLLRAPLLNGSVNDEQDITIGASYDLFDIRRANIKEEMAVLRCARDAAAAKMSQLLLISHQSLSKEGYSAKARSLRKSQGEISQIERLVTAGLADGSLTLVRAQIIRQYIEQLRRAAAQAEGEAARREPLDRLQKIKFKQLDKELVYAEQRLQALLAKSRTTDAVTLKASVDYSRRGSGSRDVTISSNGEVSAKLAFSVRLGAFSRRRYELEEVAAESRIAALYEQDKGPLWRADVLAKTNDEVLKSLKVQRRKVVLAMSAARNNSRAELTEFQPELLMAQLRSRADLVSLRSDLAALDATIADTHKVAGKLKFKN